MIVATTRGALLRGSTVDALGDEIEDNTTPFRTYTPWIESRRNEVLNPRVGTGTIANWGAYFTPTRSIIASDGPTGGSAIRVIKGSGSLNQGTYATARAQAETPAAGTPFRLIFRVRAAVGRSYQCSLRFSAGTGVPNVVVAGNGAWQETILDGVIGTFSTPLSPMVMTLSTLNLDAVIGDTLFDVDSVALIYGAAGGYFDDATADGELARYSPVGAVGSSPSIEETRSLVSDYGDFPISIIESESSEFDQSTASWRTVKKLAGRVPLTVPVDDGDRIKDLRDGAIYAVDGITRTARGISGRSSVMLKLRRTAP